MDNNFLKAYHDTMTGMLNLNANQSSESKSENSSGYGGNGLLDKPEICTLDIDPSKLGMSAIDDLVERCDDNSYINNTDISINYSSKAIINKDGNELKIDNKDQRTIKLENGIISGLNDNAIVTFNNKRLYAQNGSIEINELRSKVCTPSLTK